MTLEERRAAFERELELALSRCGLILDKSSKIRVGPAEGDARPGDLESVATRVRETVRQIDTVAKYTRFSEDPKRLLDLAGSLPIR